MKIGIHGKKFLEDQIDFLHLFIKEISTYECVLHFSAPYLKSLLKHQVVTSNQLSYQPGDDLSSFDLLITLGGDGTLLEGVTHIGRSEIPVLGINLGRMGFLATTAKDFITSALSELFKKNYTFDQRTLLRLKSKDGLFEPFNFALNDFTILKKDTSSMISVKAYIDGEYVNTYWADGIIVCTPTGSTGYSMSCGGPLVLPGSQNFVITPVSPHNLTLRPMVVPDDRTLSFKIEGRSKYYLCSLDSRFKTIGNDCELIIDKADFKVNLIKLGDSSYFKTIRQKLSWGLDYRN